VAWLLEDLSHDQASTVHTFQPEMIIGDSTGPVVAMDIG